MFSMFIISHAFVKVTLLNNVAKMCTSNFLLFPCILRSYQIRLIKFRHEIHL
jgi:hypothetical protein